MSFIHREGARIYWRIDGRADAPPLLLVNSLGTDHAMWNPVLGGLARYFKVIRFDQRGHGASDAPPGNYTIEMLGRDALAVADAAGATRFCYVGVSLGGMVGMWVAASAPERVERIVLANTSAQLAPQGFDERITQVMLGGVAAITDAVLGRFFTARYAARRTEHYETVRQTLLSIDATGYAGCCAAIRDMDLVPMLSRIVAPVLVIAGTHDPSTPPEHGRRIARALQNARYVELPTAHFSHSEQPARFVDLVVRFLRGEDVTDPASGHMHEALRYDTGLQRRKEVLGKTYVESRLAQAEPFTERFQDLITRYAWGEIWSRPVFDDRTRRLLLLAMMIGLGRWEEFRLQVDKGLAAELDSTELEELLLQAAVYCGVPAANSAFYQAVEAMRSMR
jgi:3-oxoadipate enol-lactonase / 4-carboxymuconolactone decarboxylase